ncbi:MAG: type II toxin-antitoxin system RelE/ParE family toxin [Oscillospiraceae bacterium]|jgi:plasmid stabilization system protein ParE|nr:type II toxin-antitoxin system RelE/ParE family toxin [Oscillospiraceae bacterium]
MENYKLIIHDAAREDMDGIYRYIAYELMEQGIALKMIDTLEAAISSLVEMPHRCPLVLDEHLRQKNYRKLIIKNYIAFFSIDESTRTVNVERVLYARTDWASWL